MTATEPKPGTTKALLLPIHTDEIHIWHCFTERVRSGSPDSPSLTQALELLTGEEKVEMSRFSFAEGRERYLMTRAMVRTLLSKYADVAPRDWRFEKNRYGKPEISPPESLIAIPGNTSARLRFNLSHCAGLISCAVTLGREIGVDVEETSRRSSYMDIAHHSFSPEEFNTLNAQAAELQRVRFFHYWTLKESYVKARGLGLSLGLHKFSFHPEAYWADPAAGRIKVTFTPEILDTADDWQFVLQNPSDQHQLGLAVRKGAGPDLRITVREYPY